MYHECITALVTYMVAMDSIKGNINCFSTNSSVCCKHHCRVTNTMHRYLLILTELHTLFAFQVTLDLDLDLWGLVSDLCIVDLDLGLFGLGLQGLHYKSARLYRPRPQGLPDKSIWNCWCSRIFTGISSHSKYAYRHKTYHFNNIILIVWNYWTNSLKSVPV